MKTNKKPISHTTYYILLATLFFFAFLERTVLDLGPNYELLTAAIILSAYFTNRKFTFWLAFLVIAFSDRILGNSKIFLFTWSGFLLPAFLVSPLVKNLVLRLKLKLPLLVFTGISANFFFFVWTNLGVWLLDSWGMYSKDLQGLLRCYINALPFLKNQVVSSVIFIPLGYLLVSLAYKYLNLYSLRRLPQIHKSTQRSTC